MKQDMKKSKSHTRHSHNNLIFGLMMILGLCSAASAAPEVKQPSRQVMELESQVQGQRSQPKVLFILPWEESVETQDLEIDDSIISEEDFLAPIDRAVFQQTINMYKQLDNSQ
ncbi:MAG TPA: hypothetical protein DHW71_14815 [Gammaproteobacteria bacterium]|nr:hypothetical protein [Gammaproteobacteria bacterium]HBF08779.1 hypothetical protein [Gammaproteobacteria bacterium]HCK94265.1 hypothetical protein [Gammaproteobacteria bacterium]|tara:strand:+ start:2211 stop:2549 length:339 start_codon:yes stop_codon:yes gene_type:complete